MKALEITTTLPRDEVLAALRSQVIEDRSFGRVVWTAGAAGYMGTFGDNRFSLRVARSGPQFYATYAFGEVETAGKGSMVRLTFGHRASARAAIIFMRLVGAAIVFSAVAAAVREGEAVYLIFAIFGGVILGTLLWFYRERGEDAQQLHSFIERCLGASDVGGVARR